MASKARIAKTIVGAVAFAIEWGVAFKVAQRLANALDNRLADADAEFANANAELRTRICTLEMHHGIRWSAVDECYYPYSTADDDDRPWPTMPDNGRPWPTALDNNREQLSVDESGRVGSTTLD